MFERFTIEARAVVTRAQAEARRLGHGHVGCEHLLLAVAGSDAAAGHALRDLDITPSAVESALRRLTAEPAPELDRDALASIGIDLDAVRERVEAAFGPGALTRKPAGRSRRRRRRCYTDPPRTGHIPFTPRAKKCLERSLREAVARHDHHIGVEHLALALAWMPDGMAPRLLSGLGTSPARLRTAIEHRHRQAG